MCKDCLRREPGCHDSCPIYREDKRRQEEAKQVKTKDSEYYGYKQDKKHKYDKLLTRNQPKAKGARYE